VCFCAHHEYNWLHTFKSKIYLEQNFYRKLKHLMLSTPYGQILFFLTNKNMEKTDQNYFTICRSFKTTFQNFEMWCWRRMEKLSWTDRMRNEEVLLRVNEQRNILHEIRKRKANWIGHILRRNCLLK